MTQWTVTKDKEFLRPHQQIALAKMHNGCILCGGTGSGKSRTGLYYFFQQSGGRIDKSGYHPVKKRPKDLYIITTARKRDTHEWEDEMAPFMMSTNPKLNKTNGNKIIVDSWNNVKKYSDIQGAFFIFDEQRVVGYGTWVKAFLKITKSNEWILLSATPGDTWMDYLPVFLANGFYRNKTEFIHEHVIYSRFSKFPKIDRYVNTGRLIRLRERLLVDMPFDRSTVQHHEDVFAEYDMKLYKSLFKDRWNIYENKPIENASELCYLLRKVVNSDETRQTKVLELYEKHPKCIIFYNFDYELEILKSIFEIYRDDDRFELAEWNGHAHQEIPHTERWVYLVQYTAGCEGWNCVDTDTIIFYSQNYSYKVMEQAAGRIDRLNTKFVDLYYYHLKSRASIDIAISKAINNKKKFNENRWLHI